MTAQQRYDELCANRDQYLNTARVASELTIPYLITWDNNTTAPAYLPTPWQSVGSKCVVTLSSKLMMALLPVNTSFFKLQVDESQLGESFGPEVRSELDLSFAKIEKTILEAIAASSDRIRSGNLPPEVVHGCYLDACLRRRGWSDP